MNAFEIRAKANREADVFIYGDIGASWWDEESVTAAKFVRDLQNVDADTINVRINSYGGAVADALAIYNSLRRHPATVRTYNDGVAISAASLILMAGEKVIVAENAVTMIHGPIAMAAGNAQDMRDMASILDKYAQAMAPSYAAKSGKESAEMLELLTDGKDHWYSAAEAKEAGFADEVAKAVSVEASFDLRRFKGAPAAATAFSMKGNTMPDDGKQPGGAQPTAATPTPAATPPATPTPALSVVPPAAGRTLEQNKELRAAFEPFMKRDGVREIFDAQMMDPAVTVEAARKALLDHLGKDATPANPQAQHAQPDESVKAIVAEIMNAGKRPALAK